MSVIASCTINTHQYTKAEITAAFEQARSESDRKKMDKAIQDLARLGHVRKGMTSNEVEKLLGRADKGTGIYVPGGFSLGYGLDTPDGNYNRLYWFHFEQTNLEKEAPPTPVLLVEWGYYEM
jgi:hypothetical protein